MNKIKLQVSISFFSVILSACSAANRNIVNVDEGLSIPPSLAIPADIKSASASVSKRPQVAQAIKKQVQPVKIQAQPVKKQRVEKKVVSKPQKNKDALYYIIVGTYPNQIDAIGTFSRISSLGLEQPAMESRRTKSGTLLHMVRLGPYSNQKDIDKAKNGLTSSGISGFKLVKS